MEVKVDSAWTPAQLTSTLNEDDKGVLLAVGCTALTATQPELPRNWRLVGPAEWATIVESNARDDNVLAVYARHVRDEAEAHECACSAVDAGRPVEGSRAGTTLGHWAYFCKVVEHSALDPSHGSWERKTLISGPLLTRWIERRDPLDRGVYIELMGHQGEARDLCVKCWSASELEAFRSRVSERIGIGEPRRHRRLPHAAKSCTAWSAPLQGKTPRQAAACCDELVSRLQDAAW